MKRKALYETPDAIEFGYLTETIVCTSPQPGGNEDIGYEDWLLLLFED